MSKGFYYKATPIKDIKGYFKPSELKSIIQACKIKRYKKAGDQYKHSRDELLIKLGFAQARRVSEVIGYRDEARGIVRGGLKPIDIDAYENKINWSILKKGDINYRAWKPIPPKLLKELLSYISKQGIKRHEFVFHTEGNRDMPITRQRVDQIFKSVCKLTGIVMVGNTKPHFHHLRHTWAYIALMNGVPERVVQKMMEHSSILMTAGYGRLLVDDMKGFVNKVGGFL